MTDRLSGICVVLGIAIILYGACFIMAERPVSIPDTRRARTVAYVAFALGSIVAVVIPGALLAVRHLRRK